MDRRWSEDQWLSWVRSIHSQRKFGEADVRSQRVGFCRFTGLLGWRKCGSRQYIGWAPGMHSWEMVIRCQRKKQITCREDLAWAGLDCSGEVKNHWTFYGNWHGSHMVWGFKLRWTSLYIKVIIYRLVTSLVEHHCLNIWVFKRHKLVEPLEGEFSEDIAAFSRGNKVGHHWAYGYDWGFGGLWEEAEERLGN